MVVELEEKINEIVNGRNADFTKAETLLDQWRAQNKKAFLGASFGNEIVENLNSLKQKIQKAPGPTVDIVRILQEREVQQI